MNNAGNGVDFVNVRGQDVVSIHKMTFYDGENEIIKEKRIQHIYAVNEL